MPMLAAGCSDGNKHAADIVLSIAGQVQACVHPTHSWPATYKIVGQCGQGHMGVLALQSMHHGICLAMSVTFSNTTVACVQLALYA
jgi:hypothetical protein